jgi:hypothetical protein
MIFTATSVPILLYEPGQRLAVHSDARTVGDIAGEAVAKWHPLRKRPADNPRGDWPWIRSAAMRHDEMSKPPFSYFVRRSVART